MFKHFSVIWLLLIAYGSSHSAFSSADYVGVESCVSCHQKEAEQWQLSDHYKAMAKADKQTVLGNFDNVSVTFHGVTHEFYISEGRYFVRTQDQSGTKKTFEIDYVFGHYPLQQYLIEIGDGHIQAFNVAWDSRPENEGGQRWYHLQPDEKIDADHPFHWTGSFLNWNARCAECHSTNLEKNYSAVTHSYKTSWSDINVACEACHGPGREHVNLAEKNQLSSSANTGLAYAMQQTLQWQFEKGEPIAKPLGRASQEHINMCGGCHSRRQVIGDRNTPSDYHDTYRLQTLERGLYFADGQIQDEVYVLGSFMQSKMHKAGVTCMNCHNPHSGKLIAEPNQVCAQCHQPSVYQTTKHTFHETEKQPACVDCHMPERTYMGVDARRDHSFSIPRAALSRELDLPLACDQCHSDKDDSWAVEIFKQHKLKQTSPSWIKARYQAAKLDGQALRPLYRSATDEDLPAFIRASLINNLSNFPTGEALSAISKGLNDENVMVRASAVSALIFADLQTRWRMLRPLLNDKSPLVRFEIAPLLAPLVSQAINAKDDASLKKLLGDYRQGLSDTSDMPGSQLALAELESQLGNIKAAEQAYKAALNIVPSFAPAMLNYADFLRRQGRVTDEKSVLEKALRRVSDSAAVQHSMGLFLIRKKDYQGALPFLKTAALSTSVDASPRFAYVYAVALDTLDQTPEAVNVLIDADARWPRQTESLVALVMYLEKTQQTDKVQPYLRVLNTLAPTSPQVRYWVKRYGLF